MGFGQLRCSNLLTWQPAPDSLLLNGRGGYNCSMAVKARPIECHRVEVPTIQLMDADRVRLRIVNTG